MLTKTFAALGLAALTLAAAPPALAGGYWDGGNPAIDGGGWCPPPPPPCDCPPRYQRGAGRRPTATTWAAARL